MTETILMTSDCGRLETKGITLTCNNPVRARVSHCQGKEIIVFCTARKKARGHNASNCDNSQNIQEVLKIDIPQFSQL